MQSQFDYKNKSIEAVKSVSLTTGVLQGTVSCANAVVVDVDQLHSHLTTVGAKPLANLQTDQFQMSPIT